MRMLQFASAFRRRLRQQSFLPRELAAMARNPSHRAPSAADLRDEFAFQPPGPDAAPEAWGARDLVFREGKLIGLSMSGRAFLAAGNWLEKRPIRELRLVAAQPFLEEIANCPHLEMIRRLDLSGCRMGTDGALALARSPRLGELRELILAKNDLRPEGLEAIASADWFPGLTALDLADNLLGPLDESIDRPSFPRWPTRLVKLDLSGNRWTGSLVLPKSVEQLNISRCGWGSESLERLAGEGALEPLTDLDASFNPIGPEGLAPLAPMKSCRSLNLAFNDIEDAGAELLEDLEAPLEDLDLSGNRLTAEGVAALAHSRAFELVRTLRLATNDLGDAGVMALMESENLGSLSDLDVSNCRITDRAIVALSRSGTLGGLSRLSLAWNAIGDEEIRALASCPELAALRDLDLTGCPFGFAGAVALVDSRHLLSLKRVILGENGRLPAEAAAMIRDRYQSAA